MKTGKTHVRMTRLLLSITSAALTGCGAGTGDVTLSSGAYSTTGAVTLAASQLGLDPGAQFLSAFQAATVSDFKFCVKRVKLENEDGSAQKKEGEKGDGGEADVDDIKFAPGLISVGSGTAVDWGAVNIPVGFKLRKIKVKVKKDSDLCGVNYSVKFTSGSGSCTSGCETDQDVEFKWKFEPALDLDSGTRALELSLSTVVTALRAWADSPTGSLKDKIEADASEGSAAKKN